jgi:hypothetical protein
MTDAGGISRRSALKKIGAGAAIAWTAPVLTSIASAQTAGSPPPPPPKFLLSVFVQGNGTGTVSSNPPGINSCATSCSAQFFENTLVTLTATPSGASFFGGWGGDCAAFGSNPQCNLVMSQARSATASFIVIA